MTTLDAPDPGGTSLLNPRRSAHATIRGYLYQTCLGVLRWLELKPNEILLCEGDEDLDRFLLGGGAVSEQVKAYTGGLSLSDRAVVESLGNFLRSYVALRRRGETREFVFTTTASQKGTRRSGLNFDLLEAWKAGTRTPEVIAAVRSLLEPREDDKNCQETTEAITWLQVESEGWKGFMDAVEWSFDAPDLDAVRTQVKNRLAVRDDTSNLPTETFLDRLVAYVLRTSSQPDPEKRRLSSESLSGLIETARTDLENWLRTPAAVRIRTVFDELKQVQRLLHDNTKSLPEKASPGRLLTAAYEVIPFDEAGRREELDFLTGWCGSNDRRSVLLLTGEGGSGKTRLMIEWCRHLRHLGWHAGFFRPDRKAEDLDPLLEGAAPRFVVIDYAETRLGVVEPLLLKMGLQAEGPGPKLRLVLLARRQADWWENLSRTGHQIGDLLLRSPEPRAITPLVPKDAAERETAFRTAAAGFSSQLGLKRPTDLPIPDFSRSEFERVLYLHMAALAAVQGERIETADDALKQTLVHERQFWYDNASIFGFQRSLMSDAFESVVAAVTLVGGVRAGTEALSLAFRILKDSQVPPFEITSVSLTLGILYSGPKPQKDLPDIEPLQPDLLGEELVAEALSRDEGIIGRVLDGAKPEEAYSTLTVLTRLARRRPELEKWIGTALHGRLEALAEIALEVAVATGDPIGMVLGREIQMGVPAPLLLRIVDRCEEPCNRDSVPLREVALIATDLSFRILRDYWAQPTEGQQRELARLAVNLGNRLSTTGHNEAALKLTQEALRIYRLLARTNPIHKKDLATCLMNLGPILAGLDQGEPAVQALEEAIGIWKEQANDESVYSRSSLALCLVNLGALKTRTHPREAVPLLEQAAEIYKQLALSQPTFLVSFAGCLLNLAGALSGTNQFKAALPVSRRSVEIWRKLQRERPDAYSPDLASSLLNHGAILSMLGEHEEALQFTEEGVAILRQLETRRQGSFASDLAKGLSNLGAISLDLGSYQVAAQALKESIAIKDDLNPPPLDLPFTMTADLHRLSQALLALEQPLAALQSATEALRLFKPYFVQFPQQLGEVMDPLVKTYLSAAQGAGQEPDLDILS